MIRELIAEAVTAGARRWRACEVLGLTVRTLERWGADDDDGRHGPNTVPANKLSDTERRKLVAIATSTEFRDRSPSQIVPRLADRGEYVASESTFYRVLRDEDMQHHRGRSRAPVSRPHEHVADGPWQVASWDITYLRSLVRGLFFYLYLVEDVWSRKILGWAVHDDESSDHAAALIERIRAEAGPSVDLRGWVLHADNGGPMKGATMIATLERLGVLASFSRPSVSNDNPFSEALFRTLKYRPEYPERPFADLAAARTWVTAFVQWYNHDHRHSAICFVTPEERHTGRDRALLTARHALYERARNRTPERWSCNTRNWTPIAEVRLNPEHHVAPQKARVA